MMIISALLLLSHSSSFNPSERINIINIFMLIISLLTCTHLCLQLLRLMVFVPESDQRRKQFNASSSALRTPSPISAVYYVFFSVSNSSQPFFRRLDCFFLVFRKETIIISVLFWIKEEEDLQMGNHISVSMPEDPQKPWWKPRVKTFKFRNV